STGAAFAKAFAFILQQQGKRCGRQISASRSDKEYGPNASRSLNSVEAFQVKRISAGQNALREAGTRFEKAN
ncbi:MAG: hypothetical protein L0Z50_11895, partial [Verrucomicrobiales bacterium]|nr:hypothetical protein [Verrucomicrobiales bacterium]